MALTCDSEGLLYGGVCVGCINCKGDKVSYPLSLDEYEESQLLKEIFRRWDLAHQGKCDYCNREYSTETCRFPDRHKASE